jgi:hypothetical protein
MKKTLILGLFAVLTITFSSCKKNQDITDPNNSSITPEESITLKDAAVEDVSAASDYEVDFFSTAVDSLAQVENNPNHWHQWHINHMAFGGRFRWGHCPNITIISGPNNGYPKTITLDYGDSTVLNNGRVLSGIIIINMSAPPRTDSATRIITFQNFKIDSIGIAGSTTMVFLGDNLTQRIFKINGEITYTFSDNSTLTRTEERQREWIAGLETQFDPSDDVINITGFVHAVNSDGAEYQNEITEPLVRYGNCRFIVQGIVTMSKNGEVFGTLDYGDGNCDRFATLTINGISKIIIIGRKK